MEETLTAAGMRLQSLLKLSDGTEETKAYNAAIGDAVDLLFRMADKTPPESSSCIEADVTIYHTVRFPVQLPDVPDRM